MFMHILVPVDGSHGNRVAVEQAIALAREENSSISGLFVADRRLIEAPIRPLHPATVSRVSDISPAILAWMERTRGQLQRQGELALAELVDLCETNGVPCETELAEGMIARTILERAQHVDLVIMGLRGEDTQWQGAPLGTHFETVVEQSPQPVLGIPTEVTAMEHILLAFDGSPRAVHALEITLYLARRGRRSVTILTVSENPFQIETLSLRARDYLQNQGIMVTHLIRKGPVVHTILQTAESNGCDLIILGAYGHNRDQQGRLGSDAYTLLEEAKTPVLVCR